VGPGLQQLAELAEELLGAAVSLRNVRWTPGKRTIMPPAGGKDTEGNNMAQEDDGHGVEAGPTSK
jgi:hypothetical protein